MWNNHRKHHYQNLEMSLQGFEDSRDIKIKVIQYFGMILLVWKL